MVELKEIKEKITDEVATLVVARLPEEYKQQILAEAMRDVVSGYEFKRCIEAKLKSEADRRLEGLLADTEFDKLLCAKFQEGISLFMEALPKVVAAAMVGTLIGPSQYKTGAIYRGMCQLLGLEPDT